MDAGPGAKTYINLQPREGGLKIFARCAGRSLLLKLSSLPKSARVDAGPGSKTYMNGDPPPKSAQVDAGRGLKTYMKAPLSSVSQFS